MDIDTPVFSRYLDEQTRETLGHTHSELCERLGGILSEFPTAKIISAVFAIEEPSRYDYLPASVWATFNSIAERSGSKALGQYKKVLILQMIGEIDSNIDKLNLPKSVLDLYPDTLEYVVQDLLTVPDENYLTEDGGIRDLRLTSARSIPCGAQLVDNCTYLPKSIFRNNGPKKNLQCLFFIYTRVGGLAPVYRIHTDTRYLKEFNEAGWDVCYLRIAELMRRNRAIRAMVGTSWFYDPQLERISPRLAYLQKRPVENGAYLRYDGPGEIHTKRAIAKSKTRHELFENGEYVPTCYTLIWARRDLLRWADIQSIAKLQAEN